MKKVLFVLFLLISAFALIYLTLGFFPPMEITWQQWQIAVDPVVIILTLLIAWFSTQVMIATFRIPQRIRNHFRVASKDKSLISIANAAISIIRNDYSKTKELLERIHDTNVIYHSKLLKAYVALQQNQRSELDRLIRELLHDYPKKQPEIYTIYSQWLLKIGDYRRSFDMVVAELEADPENRRNWSALLELSEKTNNFEPWFEIQSKRTPILNKDQQHRLKIGLTMTKLGQSANEKELSNCWKDTSSRVKKDAYVMQRYVEKAIELQININFFEYITNTLKLNWDESWLWYVANQSIIRDIHELIEWLRKHHPMNVGDTFHLAMASLCCRQHLWAIAKDYLRKIKNASSECVLLDAWIETNINNQSQPKALKTLMSSQGMQWVTS